MSANLEQHQLYWHNFDTGADDFRSAPETAEDAIHYVPNIPPARNMFGVYCKLGKSVTEALLLTLTACAEAWKPDNQG